MVSIITMDAKRQPEGIPALCVGYYTLVASGPLVFGTRALARVLISALCVGCYTLVASGPLVLAQGRLPVCLYPPFSRAGDRCACAMVVG